jgi:hypothetical protein
MVYKNTRNKVLKAYQWAYAQQKQAPGCQKIGKEEQKLMEEQHVNKHQLTSMESLLLCPKPSIDQ